MPRRIPRISLYRDVSSSRAEATSTEEKPGRRDAGGYCAYKSRHLPVVLSSILISLSPRSRLYPALILLLV
jgi:hypothetical protein